MVKINDAPEVPIGLGAEGRGAIGSLPAGRAIAALEMRLDQINLRHRLLSQIAEGLRAFDHDGSLSAHLDAVIGTLPAQWRFAETARQGRMVPIP